MKVMETVKILASTLQSTVVPVISNAYLSSISENGDKLFTTTWSQKNYELNKKHEFTLLYKFTQNESEVKLEKFNAFPVPSKSYLLQQLSPSGNLLAVITKQENKETRKEEFLLEVWSNKDAKCNLSVNLTSADKHGAVNSDVVFGSLSWSLDETKLAYVAEKKKPKNLSYFANKVDTSNETEETKAAIADKYNFDSSWGEQLSSIFNPVICILDLQDKTIQTLAGYPDDICPARPSFAMNNTIIFEGILKEPFKLGRIYCENRESHLFVFDINSNEVSCLTSHIPYKLMCFSATVSPNGQKVLCLHKRLSGNGDPHRSAAQLMVIDLHSKVHYLIENLNISSKSHPIYCNDLLKNCWFSNNNDVAIQAVVNFKQLICIVDLSSKSLKVKQECSTMFGVYSDVVLSTIRKLNWSRPVFQVTTLTDNVRDELPKEVEDAEVQVITNNDILSFCVIPKTSMLKNAKFPVIVWPHGGPHSVFTNDFNLYAATFAKIGFAVILANYRGSTGHTEESLNSLPGNVGTFDVQDVHDVSQIFFKQFQNQYDTENVFIAGGSHGGFLTAHHIGQYPNIYRAAALRNPVIEMASMSVVSDIPDWSYFESGIPYQQSLIPNARNYEIMLEKSPVRYVENVKAAVLLLLGEKDLRVPSFQGKLYYKILKANNKTAKLNTYPDDCHPLSNIETECDVFVNMGKWFLEHSDKLELK